MVTVGVRPVGARKLVLNNGEYQSISITAWMAENTPHLLATNFGGPEATFAAFPKSDVFMPD
ncbi:MAG: hypothetical protein NUV72_00515 [Bauldia sp.]|nr:hypothetical protein [Bauldia sp.]